MIAGDILPEQDYKTTEKTTAYEKARMLSAEEHVVIQTALVEAMSIDRLASEVTRVLMDMGSSRTYITEDIV